MAPFDVSLASPELAAPLTLVDSEPGAESYQTWDDLEPGVYVLQVPLMPTPVSSVRFVPQDSQVSVPSASIR